jgi:DtxR family Mn-dependent transcriptional regulator
MFSPLIILLSGTAVVAVVLWIVWPAKGLVAQVRRSRGDRDRIGVENALKHIYDCEYQGVTSTAESLAGALDIRRDAVGELVDRLRILGLLQAGAATLRLTPEGRSYALRVIRIHRLWERYLADETGITETEWHAEAEYKEHLLTPGEANALSARMGHPRFDPHGDPIPTAAGDLPARRGAPLTTLENGEGGRVVHIEDEPPTVYAQLVALGIHPGTQVRMIANERSRIRFAADGEETVLAPSFAASVSVVRVEEAERPEGPVRTLATLAPGEEAVVDTLARTCRGQQRRRLMDLGIVPGTVIRTELESFGSDPRAYLVRGTLVALRRAQAEQITIREKEEQEA